MPISSHPDQYKVRPASARADYRARLAYLVSHPIQYQAPLLRRIAQEPDIDLTVFFGSDFSVRGYKDVGFGGVGVKWDVPLLDGYKHVFLPRLRDGSNVGFARPLNRGILSALRGSVSQPTAQPAFDALWVHGYATANALHGILAANLLGIPVLLRAESWLRDRSRSPLKLAMKRLVLSALGSAIDAVLPIGTLNAEYWRHYFGDGVPQFLMPYAVDNTYFAGRASESRPHVAALRAEFGLDPSRPVILFASKLQTRKHCDHLISAYAQLAPAAGAEPRPYLLIVGDGEERAALQTQAAATGLSSIHFCGFRNQSELPAFFSLASVFVLPSRHEPWGLIVNEVMNASTPVIITDDVGCGPDLIDDGPASMFPAGCIYPVGDIDALANSLRRVLDPPGAAEAMGQRAFERIQSWSFEQDILGLRSALAAVLPGFPALPAPHS
jgi:glycosyltransferase involved in cell wall biosynthesis